MKTILACLATVALGIFPATASTPKHHRLQPMVQGLGIGLAHMLDSANRQPRYYPDTLPIPPYGWPLGTHRYPFHFEDYP